MKIFLLIINLFLISNIHFSQTGIIGSVTDINGNPLAGANVVISGLGIGTASDSLGNFRLLNLKDGNYSLEVSMVGYKKETVKNIHIPGSKEVVIKLRETVVQADQVVVTAGKYEQQLSELPVSASVIKGERISKKNFVSLDFALRYAPGVSVNFDQISIRGSSGYSRGAGTRVLVALDGIPIYTGDTGEIIWELIPVTEINRIEIIKGAASSLYGSTAIGGVVNIISREMPAEPFTYIKSYIGAYDKPSFNEWDWSGEYRTFNGLTFAHSNHIGNLKFTLSGTRTENLSYRQNDFAKRYIGYLKTSYSFNSVASLSFFASSLNQNRGNFVYWKDSRHILQPPDEDQGQRVNSDRYLFGLVYNHVLTQNFLLNVKTSYYKTSWGDQTISNNSSKTNLFRSEIQTTFSAGNNLIIISGVEGNTGKVNSNLFRNPYSIGIGVYSQADYKFPFPLLISAGGRFDYSKLDSLEGLSSFSPKIGLNYSLSANTILRAAAGRGFRAPTLAETFTSTSASGIVIRPNPFLKAETNLTFELGVNQNFPDLISIDGAVFQNEYYDFIEPGVDPVDGFVRFRNVTRARILGTEMNIEINYFSKLDLTANYVYLQARDIEQNKVLKYRPRNMVYTSANYNLNEINFGFDFRYWSRIEELDFELVELGLVPDGEKRVPVYVVDLFAGYNLNSFGLPGKINLNINNLLNYNYIEIIGNLSPIRNVSLSLELVF